MTDTLSEILKTDYKYVLAINTNPETFYYTYKGYNDRDEYINVLNKGGSNFEYIGVNSKVKPYIDFDKTVPPNSKNKEATKCQLLKKLIRIFVVCCNTKYNMNLQNDDVVILDGSRHVNNVYKYSFHITTKNNKHVFNGQTEAKGMIDHMYKIEKELYKDHVVCVNSQVDRSVYGKTQRLRTIYATKYNKAGLPPLVPINENCEPIVPINPLVYLVKYYEDDYVYIKDDHKEIYDCNEKTEALIYSKDNTQDSNIHYTTNAYSKTPLITDYKKDIEKLLITKGINHPQYINHQEYKERIIYKYCYGVNDVCIYGEQHERNNRHNAPLYIYINDGVVMCGCYGSKCKSKKNIKLGSILERSPLENPANALQCCEPKLTMNKHNDVNKIFNEFITDDTKKALCIKSRCGTGKTHSMYQYIHKYLKTKPEARILMISTRQSYARAMCNNENDGTGTMKTLNIINYLEYKENKNDMNELYKLPRLCISFESLHYIIKQWIPYDIVILDESESICRQLFSTTIKEGSVGVYFHLQKLINIEQCKKVFCLDADLSTPTLTLINSIKKENRLMINNTYNNNNREYYLTQDDEAWLLDIKSKITLCKKIFIVCLCLKKAEALYTELSEFLKNTNIMNDVKQCDNDSMLIIGGMGTAEKKKMKNVNTLWGNKGLVITTSATGAGVDFSKKKHFDHIYGYVFSGLAPPVEFLQICHRVRHPTSNKVHVLCNSNMTLPEASYNIKTGLFQPTRAFIYTIKNAKQYIDVVKNTVITSPKLRSVWNTERGCMTECGEEWDSHYSILQYYEYVNNYLNKQSNNYLLILKLLIEQHGDIFVLDPVKKRQKRGKVDKENKLNTVKIKGVDCNELRLQAETKAEDRHIFSKNKLRRKFRIDSAHIDDDINDICDVFTKHYNAYENAKYYHMYEETKQKASITKENKELYDSMKNKTNQNYINMYSKFIQYSNYDYSDCFKIDVNELEHIYEQMKFTKQELYSISRTGPTMVHNKVILILLRHYGLILNTHRKRNIIDGTRQSITTHYTIEPHKEIYNCLYMELYGKNGYDEKFIEMVNKHNTYMNIMYINNPEFNKRPEYTKRLV